MFKPSVGLIALLTLCQAPAWALIEIDPTRPVGYHGPGPRGMVTPQDEQLMVTAIMYSESRQTAVVNGKSVLPGDMVGNFKVENIMRNGVSFVGPKGRITVPLNPHMMTGQSKKGRS